MWAQSAGLAKWRPLSISRSFRSTPLCGASASMPFGSERPPQTLTEKIVEKHAGLDPGKASPRPGDYISLSP